METMQLSASQLEVSCGKGTIEYCRMHDITLQAWGTLAVGCRSPHCADAECDRLALVRG